MLLNLTTTHRPATDLGFLLHKHPDRVHGRSLPFGRASLFYPEAGEGRCTASLLLEVDPVHLVRGGKRGASSGLFDHYVTDRPYVASSFLSVAIARMLGTAMSGRCRGRQDLADQALPLEAVVTPLPCRGGPEILERLFAPLGYRVAVEGHPLDPEEPAWGESPYVTARISGEVRLADLLTHLFVLIPVLDNQKHYWVGRDEVDKLLDKGAGWLEEHPEKDLITKRYLRYNPSLTRAALSVLAERVAPAEPEVLEALDKPEEELEKPLKLNELRLETVVAALREADVRSVVDVGCGEGKLLTRLMKERVFTRIVGLEVSARALQIAGRRLKLERLTPRQRARIELIQGAAVYRDERLAGFDGAALVEVIEHIEPDRLPAFERTLFALAQPRVVVVTTPNREYNATFEDFNPARLRHPDHRFEWTRAELQNWAEGVAERNGYGFQISGIGEAHADFGAPTQMAVFRR
ncbi:MAG: 3' terminal RNA ribose 2'-O-methyltransferase Hen1 [Pseudomonadota bacterium]